VVVVEMCLCGRVVNGPYFEARTLHEPEITSPNPVRGLFLKPDSDPNAKFTEQCRGKGK